MNTGLIIVAITCILGWSAVFLLDRRSRRNLFTVGCPRCEDCLHLEGSLYLDTEHRKIREDLITMWMTFHRDMCGTVTTAPSLHARIMGGPPERDTEITEVPDTAVVDTRGGLNT